ncbi:NAD(P)-dependent oxidoreductase [Acidocella sp.]|uniref:NAD-dependent epimerase/dehydratase family protein n=1 Tax=Acidocella sp. TaxID=50710 RepID=UPI002622F745|nr:NAD(P)-dependent oxidoreductase [Acidocella sp.]
MGKHPVIITGAGGWLGRAALELVLNSGAEVYAFGASGRIYEARNGAQIAIRPLGELADLGVRDALVLHMAFLTREHAGRMPEADYRAANRAISHSVAEYIGRYGARGVFVPSSGAAHGAGPYGEGKREDEERFGDLGQRLAIPTVCMRVFNLAGPFINKLESYALACIIRDLQAGGPVRLRANHPVWRGYAHVADVLAIALGLLAAGESPTVFDSWGEPVELSDLAARAANVLGRPLTIERPAWQNGAADVYLGDATPYLAHAARLGRQPATLARQIADTADYLGRCFSI